MTSGTLVIWSLSRSDHGTRMLCSDGFNWRAGSDMNCQCMGHWKKLIKISSSIDYYYCINCMMCVIYVYYYFIYNCYTFWYLIHHYVTCVLCTDICIWLCGYTCYLFFDVLSIVMAHVYFVLSIFFTDTLFMYEFLHSIYYMFHLYWVDTLLLHKYNTVIWLLHVLYIYMFVFIMTISYYCYY